MKQPYYRAVGIVTIILAMFVAGIAAPVASAQSQPVNESIALSPASRDYKVNAGAELKDELTIINDGKVAYDFIVYSRPYSVSGEEYQANYTQVGPNTDVYQWVRFSKTNYHIEPNQTIKIPYTVTVPATAAPGGHYGVIFAETQPDGNASGTAIIRKKRVGAVIYANVNGTYVNKGEFLDVSLPFWQLQPPMSASIRVQNTGNSDFKDEIRLTVKDLFGGVKYDAIKQYPVLPQTTRKINVNWDQSPWFGIFRVEITQKFLDKQQSSSGYVLMMPRFIPAVLLVLVLAGGGYAIYRRKKHRTS